MILRVVNIEIRIGVDFNFEWFNVRKLAVKFEPDAWKKL